MTALRKHIPGYMKPERVPVLKVKRAPGPNSRLHLPENRANLYFWNMEQSIPKRLKSDILHDQHRLRM